MEEIENLRVLVDSVTSKISIQIKQGNLDGLKEMLWFVPTNVLSEFMKRENTNI